MHQLLLNIPVASKNKQPSSWQLFIPVTSENETGESYILPLSWQLFERKLAIALSKLESGFLRISSRENPYIYVKFGRFRSHMRAEASSDFFYLSKIKLGPNIGTSLKKLHWKSPNGFPGRKISRILSMNPLSYFMNIWIGALDTKLLARKVVLTLRHAYEITNPAILQYELNMFYKKRQKNFPFLKLKQET